MIARAIVTEARSYLGVRWVHQGRSRAGIDCIGLPIQVAKTLLGWSFDVTDYERQASDETMINLCRERLLSVRRDALQPGDVVVMRFENQRHAGIIGDYPVPGHLSLIHAYAPSRKVVEQRIEETWSARIVGCFRFPGVA